MKSKLCLLILFFILITPALSFEPPQTKTLALTHANLIDGVSARPLNDVTVVIRDGRIDSIVTSGETPPGATVLDLKGRWLLPGFIDAHAHVGDMRAARVALASGSTTLRCLGVNHFADVGIRELHRAGVADLPDVIAAGYHVRPRMAEEFFMNFPAMSNFMNGLSGAENVRRAVRAMIERGANVIKTMGTERAGLPDTDPRKRVFTDDELTAIVDEARKHNVFVACHAHGDEGARAAVRAGVRSIEHGTYLSDETLALMKERGTYLVPTIATVMDLIDPGGDYDNPVLAVRGRAMLPRIREVTTKASKMGIRIVAGTDTSYGPASIRRMPHEIIELVACGMSQMDAIKAATSVSAECLGIDNRTGAVKKALEADLVVIDRNPLTDITAIQDVLVVINNGQIVVNRIVW
ncbi:MAG TPA: amidohydrolase family protein [Blastocatellia bacterium]|jgi:imidazolonepropionase-like amidohydrolase